MLENSLFRYNDGNEFEFFNIERFWGRGMYVCTNKIIKSVPITTYTYLLLVNFRPWTRREFRVNGKTM